jgi:hypothetical protein
VHHGVHFLNKTDDDWLVVDLPLRKNEFVSWVTIPNWMESHKSHVPVTTNQMINAGYPET